MGYPMTEATKRHAKAVVRALFEQTDRLCLSNRQVAERIGVKPNAVSRWRRAAGCPLGSVRDACVALTAELRSVPTPAPEGNGPLAVDMPRKRPGPRAIMAENVRAVAGQAAFLDGYQQGYRAGFRDALKS